jgi:hypothetical protein
MGGSAFKQKFGIESKRLDNNDFAKFSNFVEPVLYNYFNKVHSVRCYKNKESHGDKDVIVSDLKSKNHNWKEDLQKDLNALHLINNGSVTSYLINGFQLDIDFVNKDVFDSHTFYADFDPAGNLMGKLYHRFGIQYGGDGLFYVLRELNNTYKLGKIFISKDNKKICEFLGLDYTQKASGDFNNQEDIFKYIISSKNFTPEIFAFEEMAHKCRTRDRKRPSYNNFLKFIENIKSNNQEIKKENRLEIINSYFPESKLLEQINQLKANYMKKKELHEKFNGSLVQKWTGLSGAELGKCLASFKFYIDKVVYYGMDLDFDTFLERHSERLIEKTFKEWYSQQNKIGETVCQHGNNQPLFCKLCKN